MSMAYFDNDNDEYGWEDELAFALPPAEDSWTFQYTSAPYEGDGTINRLVATQAVASAYESLITSQINFHAPLSDYLSLAGTYYTTAPAVYQPAIAQAYMLPETTSGTYAGITRNNEAPAWRSPIG